jgi:hypothetical protein
MVRGVAQGLKTFDNKLLVQSIARPINTFPCFTHVGDNLSNPHDVGGGASLRLHHQVGDSTSQSIYVDFNGKENNTFIQEGLCQFTGAVFDQIVFEVVPNTTAFTLGANTFFNAYGPFVVPAAGDGVINILPADMRFVEVGFNIDNPTVRQYPGFWNADYSTETHQFSNITPALQGDGQYNMFLAEFPLVRPVNLMILGDRHITLNPGDVAQLCHGNRVKFTFITDAPDHEWFVTVTIALHRSHTVTFQ